MKIYLNARFMIRQAALFVMACWSVMAALGSGDYAAQTSNGRNNPLDGGFKMVRLKKPTTFPAVMGGKVVGSIQLPVGTALKLLSIDGGVVVVEYQGATQRLEAKATDVMERIGAVRTVLVSTPGGAEREVRPDAVPSLPVEAKEDAVNHSNPSLRLSGLQSPERLKLALERAGGNRPELEKALAGAGKIFAEEMETLIAHARQYDLVNLTAEHLLHTVEFSKKAREEMPWGRSVPEAIWLEYVLPYRVADEGLDDWRPEFYKTLSPVVRQLRDTRAAARAIHQWLYRGGKGKERITFKVSDSRDQSPRQMLHHTKIARCFELNLALVAMLRSVGIPARHAGVAYWTGSEAYHYWVEYWDSGSKKWLALEPNPNPDALPVKAGRFAVAYAFPGFCEVSDPIGRERWDLMTNVSKEYAPSVGTLEVRGGSRARNGATFAVYVWNFSAWRMVASQVGKEKASFELAVNDLRYPYLVSVSANDAVAWQFVRVSAGQAEILNLDWNTSQQEAMVEYKVKTPQKGPKKK